MPGWLEETAGGAIQIIVLLDVFLTVLYARIVTSIVANRMARLTWWTFKEADNPLAHGARAKVLSFCGLAILVLLVAA